MNGTERARESILYKPKSRLSAVRFSYQKQKDLKTSATGKQQPSKIMANNEPYKSAIAILEQDPVWRKYAKIAA